MLESKSSALPLGYTPLFNIILLEHNNEIELYILYSPISLKLLVSLYGNIKYIFILYMSKDSNVAKLLGENNYER